MEGISVRCSQDPYDWRSGCGSQETGRGDGAKLFEGIKYAKAGNHLNDISKAIQEYAESFGFGVVRDLVGTESVRKCMKHRRFPNFVPAP